MVEISDGHPSMRFYRSVIGSPLWVLGLKRWKLPWKNWEMIMKTIFTYTSPSNGFPLWALLQIRAKWATLSRSSLGIQIKTDLHTPTMQRLHTLDTTRSSSNLQMHIFGGKPDVHLNHLLNYVTLAQFLRFKLWRPGDRSSATSPSLYLFENIFHQS